MKKIIFYTDTPIHGGAERHMLLLAKHINKDKYDVSLVCSNYKQLNEWVKEWKHAGFTIHRLNVSHKHDPRHHFQLKKLIKEEKPDLLHLHLWNPGGCRYAFSATNKRTTKIISTEHDPFPIHGLKKAFKKSALKKTDHTITVSNGNRDLMLKLYPKLLKGKITTVHNGIDLTNFAKQLRNFSTQHRNKLRQKLFNATPSEFIITTIAELHPRKGLIYLAEAFKLVNEKEPNVKLIIVGKGPQQKILEKLIKKLDLVGKVMLIGEHENIPQILKSSNMFVLPSVKEAFGLVLLEALAAGLPIIASQTGGIPEIIENNKNGKLVPPQDYNAMAETITEVIESNAIMQKMVYIGNHRVKNFDVKEMVRKTEEIYAKFIG